MADQPEDRKPSTPEGLEAAFAEIRPHLLRYAKRMCGNTADAEDLLQDAFLRAVRRGFPADVRSIQAWLTTTLHNLIIDRCRSMARRPSHETMNDNDDSLTQLEPDGPEPAWKQITVHDIRDALEVIEPVYREVYELHTFEFLSYDEVARRLKIQRVTVGTRLNRARKKLREVLVARFGLEHAP
jgi:RNA polymerase sigma-70 factor (ECF subfamily)